MSEFFFKSVNIWQSYKQERGCLTHFARLANTLLQDEESHEAITFLLVTLPNTHRFHFLTRRLSNKPLLISILTTPPHLKYKATLPCSVSLMACFTDNNVSQGSVATYARCDGILNII